MPPERKRRRKYRKGGPWPASTITGHPILAEVFKPLLRRDADLLHDLAPGGVLQVEIVARVLHRAALYDELHLAQLGQDSGIAKQGVDLAVHALDHVRGRAGG